ncbi:DsrE family protein [Carnimonas bestiolae]|uniref:DsrE family protein n=1 Tax=Carnimonas bestiolae TaxID=3402172 RepID=UPI003EDC73E6
MSSLPSLLIIVRHAPQGTHWVAEALDVALLNASFGGDTALYFCDDGVTALLDSQTRGALDQKGTLNTIKALEMYDIDTLYVDAASLSERGLEPQHLVQQVTPALLPALLKRYQRSLVF